MKRVPLHSHRCRVPGGGAGGSNCLLGHPPLDRELTFPSSRPTQGWCLQAGTAPAYTIVNKSWYYGTEQEFDISSNTNVQINRKISFSENPSVTGGMIEIKNWLTHRLVKQMNTERVRIPGASTLDRAGALQDHSSDPVFL